MKNISLPLPDGTVCALPLTLALVEAMEADSTCLLALAQDVVAGTLPISRAVHHVRIFYRHAGCTVADAALGDFLLHRAPLKILADVLLAILTPLQQAGGIAAAPVGEDLPPAATTAPLASNTAPTCPPCVDF